MGDIFFTRTSETIDEIGFPSVMLDEPKDTVFSGFVLRGRALQDDPLTLQFKRYVFFTDAFRKEMVKKSSITTRALTSGTAIKNMEFVFPKNKKEQEFIGNFFRHLDRLITLHQCNCNMATRPCEWSSGLRAIAWEQRKLGEIADKVTEKNTTLRYTEALTNSAEFGIIGQRDFFDHDVAKLSSLHGYYIVKEDDFVYNPRISVTAPVGPVNRNKLGKIGVVSPLYTVLRTAQIDNEFLEWFFKSACWHSFMIFNGDSGARSDRFSIKNSTFFEMPIPCPCRMEQVRIGTFFRHLDRLITLHQRKHILLT